MSKKRNGAVRRFFFALFHQLLHQRHQAADTHADVHHLPGNVSGHPAAEQGAYPQAQQDAHHADPRHRQQRYAEIPPHHPHGEVDEVGSQEQELHIAHVSLLVPGDGHEVQGHHGAADGERPGAAAGEGAAHQPRRQARLQLHPLGEEEEIRCQRDEERPEQRRQHVQVEPAQQVDDHQAAHGVQSDGHGDLLHVDVLAIHPRHGAGLRHANQRHDGGRNGHVVERAGRHHHHHRRTEARQRLDDAAHQRRQPHHYIFHRTHRLFCRYSGHYTSP